MPIDDIKHYLKGTSSDDFQFGKGGPSFFKNSGSELELKQPGGQRANIVANIKGGFNLPFQIVSNNDDHYEQITSSVFSVIGQNGILIRDSLPSSFTAKLFVRSKVNSSSNTGTFRLCAKKLSDNSDNFSDSQTTNDDQFSWKTKDISSFILGLSSGEYILEAQSKVDSGNYRVNSFILVIYA